MQRKRATTKTVDVIFGLSVSTFRTASDMSQRDFAEKLTELGMKVDASAVSRIEKGSRSVRLPEAMLIADALGISFESLTRFARTSKQVLSSARDTVNVSSNELRQAIDGFFYALFAVVDHLGTHPELISELKDDELGSPKDPLDYLRWINERAKRNYSLQEGQVVIVDSEEQKELYLNVLRTFGRLHLATDDEYNEQFPEDGDDSGIDSEEA